MDLHREIIIKKRYPFSIPLILSFVTLQTPFHSLAQEALGIVNGNYSGVNALWINPANAVNSKRTLSINLLAGDAFINSNYVFIHRKDYNFLNFLRVNTSDPEYMYVYDYPEYIYSDTIHYYDYYKNNALKNLYFSTRVAGPSVLFRLGDHAVSLLTGFRTAASGDKIPYHVANFGFHGLDFIPQQDKIYEGGGPFDMEMLSWIEIGAGYTYTFFNDFRNKFSAGITVRYLLGTAAAYASFRDISYMVPYQDTLIVYRTNTDFGLSLPMDYASNAFSLNPLVKGTGFSGDIGLSYVRVTEGPSRSSVMASREGEWDESYRFRAGISLLDVGYIKFNKSVQVHHFRDVQNRIWPGLIDFNPGSIQEFFRSASYNLLGDSLASLTDQSSFRMYLPTAFSVQFDYNFDNNIYINATYLQGIRLGKPGIRRETLLAVTPRYETPLWEVNLPLSIVDFKHPAVGFSVRVYNLVIGTEKLGTLFNLTDIRGLDLYFSLGISLDPKVRQGKYRTYKTKQCESIREYKRYQIH